MSFCFSGMGKPITPGHVTITISDKHPLVQLSNVIPWKTLESLVLPDLKKTTLKSMWWLGRKLKLRIHLAIYILQQLFNKTDRQIEYDVKDNAAYQLFCGRNIVDNWHCPDHTKIEAFRSRLSPETQRNIANTIAILAVQLGFANPAKLDVDSTIQDANMAFPSDANLMVKIAAITKKFIDYLKKHGKPLVDKNRWKTIKNLKINMRAIWKQQRNHFFTQRYTSCIPSDSPFAQEFTKGSLFKLWLITMKQVLPIWIQCKDIHTDVIDKLPWATRRALTQIGALSGNYMLSVVLWLQFDSPTKRNFCFHLNAVDRFNKGKLNNKIQFGRNFQIGRIHGNFLFASESINVRMEDKPSLPAVIETHQALFGEKTLQSCTFDRGYYSKDNQAFLEAKKLKEFRLPKPGLPKPKCATTTDGKFNETSISPQAKQVNNDAGIKEIKEAKKLEAIQQKLNCRHQGIEALIGHAKHGGQLGRSRMKSDLTILASGYTALLGFNLRQLIRYQKNQLYQSPLMPKT